MKRTLILLVSTLMAIAAGAHEKLAILMPMACWSCLTRANSTATPGPR